MRRQRRERPMFIGAGLVAVLVGGCLNAPTSPVASGGGGGISTSVPATGGGGGAVSGPTVPMASLSPWISPAPPQPVPGQINPPVYQPPVVASTGPSPVPSQLPAPGPASPP